MILSCSMNHYAHPSVRMSGMLALQLRTLKQKFAQKILQNQIDCFSFRCILYMYSFCIKCRLCISQITSCSLLNISLFAAQLFSLFTMSVCPPAIFPFRILQTEIHTKKPEKLHTKITFVIFYLKCSIKEWFDMLF